MKTIKNAKTFDELLDIRYGKSGTPERDEFKTKSKVFIVGKMIKEAKKSSIDTRRFS